jgi:hypothetical protein
VTDYRQAKRPDLAILDVLWKSAMPITLHAIQTHVCSHQDWVSADALASHTKKLALDGMVDVSSYETVGVPHYSITVKGRTHLVAAETHFIMGGHPPAPAVEEPAQVSVCDLREPEVPDPAIATICIDEDELNNWWDGLGVEAKADAFTRYALDTEGRDSHVYIEPTSTVSVPIIGTAGESAEEWAASARLQQRFDELAGAPKPHMARPDAPPDAPMPMDMLCVKCGERGGYWKRGKKLQPGKAVSVDGSQRVALSNDNSGPYLYMHQCDGMNANAKA